MTEPLPAPAPARTPETDAFWAATATGQLLLTRCAQCAAVIWYPRALCPDCGSTSVTWMEASGLGTVYSFTVVHRGTGPYRDAAPYIVAYVELAEGPRVLTNLVGCAPDQAQIGQRVRVVFCDTGEASSLYRFEPAPDEDPRR